MSSKVLKPVRRFARHVPAMFLAATALAWFPGCATIHDALTDDPPPPITGSPISTLAQVGQIEFHDGRLLATVSMEYEGWVGIAVIDTSADTVIGLMRPFGFTRTWSIASFRDSLLYAASPYRGVHVRNPSGTWTETPIASDPLPGHLLPTPNALLAFNRYGREVHSLDGGSPALRFRMPPQDWIPSRDYLTGAILSGTRLIAARPYRRDLLVADAATGSILDSIKMDSLPGRPGLRRRPEAIAAHGGRLFVSVSVVDTSANQARPDTALIAVLDSATLALDTILRLRFTYRPLDTESPFVPRISQGTWYLPGYNLSPSDNTGGVEMIDLDGGRLLPDVIAPWQADPAWSTGGKIVWDLLPAGPGKAYAITGKGGERRLERLSF